MQNVLKNRAYIPMTVDFAVALATERLSDLGA